MAQQSPRRQPFAQMLNICLPCSASPLTLEFTALPRRPHTFPHLQIPTPGNESVPLGTTALLSFGFFTDKAWIWIGVGYLIGVYFLTTVLSCISLAVQVSAGHVWV